METVTEQPIKKIEFFRCPQSLPGVAPLTTKPEDSGYEIDSEAERKTDKKLVGKRMNYSLPLKGNGKHVLERAGVGKLR